MGRAQLSRAIFDTMARDFICAHAVGWGYGVAVTYRELLIATERLYRRPAMRRYRLSDIESVIVCTGKDIDRVHIAVGGAHPARLMVLYGHSATYSFEHLVATVHVLLRSATRPARTFLARETERELTVAAWRREDLNQPSPRARLRLAGVR